MRRILGAAAILLGTIAAAPAIAAKAPQVLSQAEQAQLEDNLRRGRQIYDYDQAAWHTTDAMLEHLPEAQREQVRGWVITDVQGGEKATYFGVESAKRYVLYSAVWDGSAISQEVIAPAGGRETLSAEQESLAAALDAALPAARNFGRCSSAQFNAVVLPAKSPGDAISVYFLTPQTKDGEYPFGGHYRVDVRNGAVVSQRPFTKTCISLNAAGTKTETVAAMYITHLLDPVPTEIHVFGMLASGKALAVGVPDGRVYMLSAPKGRPQYELISVK